MPTITTITTTTTMTKTARATKATGHSMILYNTQLNTSKTTGTTVAIAITRPVGVFDGRVAKNAYELVAKHTLAKV